MAAPKPGMDVDFSYWPMKDDESCGWRLSISRDGKNIVFGFYFGSKPLPTHTFSCTSEQLQSATAVLTGQQSPFGTEFWRE